MRAVHHMHDQIGFGNLLQRGLERFNQLRRQATHEPDSIDVRILTSIFGARPAHCGVQCGEQRILHQFRGTGQPIRQRRFARIRISHHGNGRQSETTASATFDVTCRSHLFDLFAEFGDSTANHAAVHFDFRFAWSSRADACVACGSAACLSRQ